MAKIPISERKSPDSDPDPDPLVPGVFVGLVVFGDDIKLYASKTSELKSSSNE